MTKRLIFTLAFLAAGIGAWAEPTVTPVEVGSQAPDFTLTGDDGKTYRLAEMRERKNVVLVFFRGTW